VEHFTKKAGERGVRQAVHASSCTLQVRAGRGELYIPAQLISSNSRWHDGWFYLRNDDNRLPKFSRQVLMLRKDNWSYGVVEDDKPKLQPLLDELRRLRLCGLSVGMVAAVFHHRRVLSLMQRRLWLDEMMSGVSLEGSRMSHETLPLDEVTRRVRWMVGSFRQEDIDRVPMQLSQRFEPLVSTILLVPCSPLSLGLVDLKLIEFVM
jgi:ribosome modulation factor